jgi:hypothetical protein
MGGAGSSAEFNLPAALSLLPAALDFTSDFDFARIPEGPGVFLLETGGEPFLGKSASLRRRLARLLAECGSPKGLPEGVRNAECGTPPSVSPAPHSALPRASPWASRTPRPRLNLRAATRRIHYRATGSAFETTLLLYQAMRALYPQRYRELLRLRHPPLLKLNLDNPWPRSYVTRRLGRKRALYYGPFPSRTAAEKFAPQILDLFLVRRCREEIRPDPAHPGCIYGEMNMCLRPCQDASTSEQYQEEVGRLASFLTTAGASLLKELETQRDRASEALDFEEAARLHKRIEKVREALKHRPDLAVDLERLHGLVVQRAAAEQSAAPAAPAVMLFPVWRGYLLPAIRLALEVIDGKPVSLDARLREALSGLGFRGGTSRVRAEHMALLARWYYRGARQGEFVPFESYERIPFRKVVGAISRVLR